MKGATAENCNPPPPPEVVGTSKRNLRYGRRRRHCPVCSLQWSCGLGSHSRPETFINTTFKQGCGAVLSIARYSGFRGLLIFGGSGYCYCAHQCLTNFVSVQKQFQLQPKKEWLLAAPEHGVFGTYADTVGQGRDPYLLHPVKKF